MKQVNPVLNDRGSRYAVSGGEVCSEADAKAFIKSLLKNKRFAKATHNTWAARFSGGKSIKNDDGESGAGMVILKMLEQKAVENQIVVVTRWYGGVKLGGDRFRHVQTCVNAYFDE